MSEVFWGGLVLYDIIEGFLVVIVGGVVLVCMYFSVQCAHCSLGLVCH